MNDILFDKYKKLRIVSQTNPYTSIYKVSDENENYYAIKILNLENLPREKRIRDEIINRFEQAPNINKIFPDDDRFIKHFGDVQTFRNKKYYLTEWCENTLWDYIDENDGLNSTETMQLFEFLLDIATKMHNEDISHRDIHLGQILIRKDFSSLVLSDFDTFKNPSNPMTYQDRGRLVNIPPSQLEYEKRAEDLDKGIVSKFSNKATDVFQLGMTMACAILKRQHWTIQTDRIKDELYKSLNTSFIKYNDKKVNLFVFYELISDIISERITNVKKIKIIYNTKVIESKKTYFIRIGLNILSTILLSLIIFLYAKLVKIIGKESYHYLILITTIYIFVSAIVYAYISRTKILLSTKELMQKGIILFAGNIKNKIAVFSYLLITSILLSVLTFSELKGNMLISIGFKSAGYDINCVLHKSSISKFSDNRVTSIENFHNYLKSYSGYLKSLKHKHSNDANKIIAYIIKLNNYAKINLNLLVYADNLEEVRKSKNDIPQRLLFIIKDIYVQSLCNRDLNNIDKKRILDEFYDIGTHLNSEFSAKYTKLIYYYSHCNWNIINDAAKSSDWDILMSDEEAREMINAAYQKDISISLSKERFLKFFRLREYTGPRSRRRFLRKLCKYELVPKNGALIINPVLTNNYLINDKSKVNKIIVRDIIHWLDCNKNKKIRIKYFSNVVGNERTLLNKSIERQKEMEDLFVDYCHSFNVSTSQIEHIVIGPKDPLYDPFTRPIKNARIEISIIK